MQRLKSYYFQEVIPFLLNTFHYSNVNEVPYIKKIIVTRTFNDSCQSPKVISSLLEEVTLITGQRPYLIRSKKAISNFKIKENMPVGASVNLRGFKMYSFLDRLINLTFPRIKDFQGFSEKGFVKGNFSFGFNDLLMFPEIEFDNIMKVKGANIVIVTTASNNIEAIHLLKKFGFPFRN